MDDDRDDIGRRSPAWEGSTDRFNLPERDDLLAEDQHLLLADRLDVAGLDVQGFQDDVGGDGEDVLRRR